MASSYLILDEYMRFLDKDRNLVSGSILDVGVEKALSQICWDEEAFQERGGLYDWSRDEAITRVEAQACANQEGLDW